MLLLIAAFTVIIATYADTAGMKIPVIREIHRSRANIVPLYASAAEAGEPDSDTAVIITGSMDLENTCISSAVWLHSPISPDRSRYTTAVTPSAPARLRINGDN